ncbi:MAG TPA: TRAP transporter small permease [Syntrophorhabdaceae bacterium]|nr:TRAP transporter small permease [Syntrophorhabdaceae bacterium]
MNGIKYVFDRIFAGLTWAAFGMLIIMTILIFADVFCRYLLNFSIFWADEVSLILMIWFTFIALAVGVRKKIHIAIDFVLSFLPDKVQTKIVARIVDVFTFIFGVTFVYFGIALCRIGTYSTLAATEWPSYTEYVFIPVSGLLVIYTSVENFLQRSKGPEYLDTIFLGQGDKDASLQ